MSRYVALASAIIALAAMADGAHGSSEARGEADQGVTGGAWDALVVGTAEEGTLVLPGPGTVMAAEALVPEGATVQVVEGPKRDREGRYWYLITGYGPPGAIGWSISEFLVPVDPGGVDPAAPAAAVLPDVFERTFEAKLTGYAHGTTTRSGTPVRWGVVAVDPRVIPLGSRLTIEGFDLEFVAEDTGGGVRGNHVDIYFTDELSAIQFGVRYRRVTVLD